MYNLLALQCLSIQIVILLLVKVLVETSLTLVQLFNFLSTTTCIVLKFAVVLLGNSSSAVGQLVIVVTMVLDDVLVVRKMLVSGEVPSSFVSFRYKCLTIIATWGSVNCGLCLSLKQKFDKISVICKNSSHLLKLMFAYRLTFVYQLFNCQHFCQISAL